MSLASEFSIVHDFSFGETYGAVMFPPATHKSPSILLRPWTACRHGHTGARPCPDRALIPLYRLFALSDHVDDEREMPGC